MRNSKRERLERQILAEIDRLNGECDVLMANQLREGLSKSETYDRVYDRKRQVSEAYQHLDQLRGNR